MPNSRAKVTSSSLNRDEQLELVRQWRTTDGQAALADFDLSGQDLGLVDLAGASMPDGSRQG